MPEGIDTGRKIDYTDTVSHGGITADAIPFRAAMAELADARDLKSNASDSLAADSNPLFIGGYSD